MNDTEYVALRGLATAGGWESVPLVAGLPAFADLEQAGWVTNCGDAGQWSVTEVGRDALRRAQSARGDWRYPKVRALWEALIDLQGCFESAGDALRRLNSGDAVELAGLNDEGHYCPPPSVVKAIDGRPLTDDEAAFRGLVDYPPPVVGIRQRVYWSDRADDFWRAWMRVRESYPLALAALDAAKVQLADGERRGEWPEWQGVGPAIMTVRRAVMNLWRSGWNPYRFDRSIPANILGAVRDLDRLRRELMEGAEAWPVAGPVSENKETCVPTTPASNPAEPGLAPVGNVVVRPDFHLTTDIRATSDPLWQRLATFRRRLMEGSGHIPAEWHSLLLDIRQEAHAAGLRPQFGAVEYIVAELKEVREDDASGFWSDVPDNWSMVVLTAWGPGGGIELHDLLDRFADTDVPPGKHKRLSAIEWAESWMNARERQLSAPAVVPLAPDLLDRLQLAAAVADPDVIDRAAERAVEKVARALGNSNKGTNSVPVRTEVVLWEGAAHTDRNIRLARTRTAYMEAHGNVVAALAALKAGGNGVSRRTFYNHLDALDLAIPHWRDSVQLCSELAQMHGTRIVGTRGKSGGKSG